MRYSDFPHFVVDELCKDWNTVFFGKYPVLFTTGISV